MTLTHSMLCAFERTGRRDLTSNVNLAAVYASCIRREPGADRAAHAPVRGVRPLARPIRLRGPWQASRAASRARVGADPPVSGPSMDTPTRDLACILRADGILAANQERAAYLDRTGNPALARPGRGRGAGRGMGAPPPPDDGGRACNRSCCGAPPGRQSCWPSSRVRSGIGSSRSSIAIPSSSPHWRKSRCCAGAKDCGNGWRSDQRPRARLPGRDRRGRWGRPARDLRGARGPGSAPRECDPPGVLRCLRRSHRRRPPGDGRSRRRRPCRARRTR